MQPEDRRVLLRRDVAMTPRHDGTSRPLSETGSSRTSTPTWGASLARPHAARERATTARASRGAKARRKFRSEIHREGPPRCASPPRWRTTATTTSARAILLSNRVRYQSPTSGPKTGLPRPTRRATLGGPTIDTVGPPMKVAPALGRAPPATRPHRCASAAEHQDLDAAHAPPESSVQPSAAPLRRGWTRAAFDGTVGHGERVLRRARHEGPGLITRTFTFSDAPLLLRHRPSWR